ncbi:hypothetical protein LMM39_000355 [Salmonella enterica]|nr:hypothetical protein [Salmonella enterica]EDV3219616.1 hypothetical protein [Salmonella enterica subsp. enterica serovar Gaminara]EDW4628628.1 hypothetical protein [Salmonella enterica subsp. enterica serovar Javiana]EEO8663308.1 hypothetical protein [Salmonella enterica subsp. enterica serovar Rubislaw]EDY9994236.1 hypothetical protein [Salmonella enterica]EEA1262371.1 hypothetical protein [Salmonella enterica]
MAKLNLASLTPPEYGFKTSTGLFAAPHPADCAATLPRQRATPATQ